MEKAKIKSILKKVIKERIENVSATLNPEDAKYPLTLQIIVSPTSINNFNKSHSGYENYKKAYLAGNVSHLLKKRLTIQGDYAARGNTGVKTLRLKIKKSDWPPEWTFPDDELSRRLFLQNFRLSNLSLLKPYDEGGEKYEELFPPEPDTPIEVKFENDEDDFDYEEETEVEEETEEENTVPGAVPGLNRSQASLKDVFDMLDVLQDSAFENAEYSIARNLNLAVRQLAMEVVQTRKKRKK
jgi:hypothetical protein